MPTSLVPQLALAFELPSGKRVFHAEAGKPPVYALTLTTWFHAYWERHDPAIDDQLERWGSRYFILLGDFGGEGQGFPQAELAGINGLLEQTIQDAVRDGVSEIRKYERWTMWGYIAPPDYPLLQLTMGAKQDDLDMVRYYLNSTYYHIQVTGMSPVWRERQNQPPLPNPPGQETAMLSKNEAFRFLDAAEPRYDAARQPMIQMVQADMDQLAGKSCASIEDNQAVTARIQQLLRKFGLRVECPACHQPATIQCRKVGGVKTGYFQFLHSISGRVKFHLGFTVLPALKVIPAPPELRHKASKSSRTSTDPQQ